MVQLMPLSLTVSCSSKIQIGFTFLVPAHLGSPGQRAVKRVCVCMDGMICCRPCKFKKNPSGNIRVHELLNVITTVCPLPALLVIGENIYITGKNFSYSCQH